MTVRIDSPDGDSVFEDVEKEFVENYNETYGEDLARVLPSAWRLVSYALLVVFLVLLGISLGNLMSQKKINELNAELVEAERKTNELQSKVYRRLKFANQLVEELRLRTKNLPPFERDPTPELLANYTMFKELHHVTKDIESQPKYRKSLRLYFKQPVVDRLYGD